MVEFSRYACSGRLGVTRKSLTSRKRLSGKNLLHRLGYTLWRKLRGGYSTVEREVARVAAACDLRAFRYLPFPGIEFDPLPLQAEPAPELVPEPAPSVAALSIPIPPEPEAVPPEPVAAPIPAPEPVAPPAVAAPLPLLSPRPDVFRQDRPDWDVPEPAPRPAAPAPRYRMLEDLAIEPPAATIARPAELPSGHRPAARAAMPALSGAAAPPPPASSPSSPPAPAPSADVPMVPPSRGPNPLPRGPRPRRAWPR